MSQSTKSLLLTRIFDASRTMQAQPPQENQHLGQNGNMVGRTMLSALREGLKCVLESLYSMQIQVPRSVEGELPLSLPCFMSLVAPYVCISDLGAPSAAMPRQSNSMSEKRTHSLKCSASPLEWHHFSKEAEASLMTEASLMCRTLQGLARRAPMCSLSCWRASTQRGSRSWPRRRPRTPATKQVRCFIDDGCAPNLM